jgi:hypothetical protein
LAFWLGMSDFITGSEMKINLIKIAT